MGRPAIRLDSFVVSSSWLGSSISGNASPDLKVSRMGCLHCCSSPLSGDPANLKPASAESLMLGIDPGMNLAEVSDAKAHRQAFRGQSPHRRTLRLPARLLPRG